MAIGGDLTQYDWCSYKRGNLETADTEWKRE